MQAQEGTIRLANGFRVWYRQVGDGGATPLLVLHGGPGAGHDYLEPLEALAADRPVVFYDQLGCGKSDRPDNPALWTIDRFVREIDEVRAALNLRQIHLFGQSWGGMLAIEYMLGRPRGIAGLVLADTCASMPQLRRELKQLRKKLPPRTRAALDHAEATGDFQSPEYREAIAEFYHRHVCRLPSPPDCLRRSAANLADNPVYRTMNGPNELVITGNLKTWDRTNRLHEIHAPTLVIVGRYDELTPACAQTICREIPGAKLAIFENSAHLPHIEEPGRYLRTLAAFLASADRP